MSTMPFAGTLLFFAALGLAFGSFGNVLIFRLAEYESVGGRSTCRACRHPLAWHDLVPVLSYVVLHGKCRYCGEHISLQYIMVELATMFLFIMAILLYPDNIVLASGTAGVFFGLMLVCVFDLFHEQIPDVFTAIIFAGAALTALAQNTFESPVMGALVSLGWFGGQWLVSRGKYVGAGDIFLGASLGVWLGLRDTIAMLALSYITGALVAGFLLLSRKVKLKESRLPFAPFLAVGALLAYLGVGDAYLSLLVR